MEDYLRQLQRMIEISDGDADGLVIVNREGFVEYYKGFEGPYGEYIKGVEKRVIGHHVLEVYPELTEENSTVIKAIRTGKTVVGGKQTLSVGPYRITILSVTHPIFVAGEVQGAIDVIKCCGVSMKNSTEDLNRSLYDLDDIITQDSMMITLKETVKRVAETASTVLIYGETGTGKELVAESVHMASKRRKKPFVSQNCAAIPSNLLEGIFFGTEKGSFTGAESRRGLFEIADGGTLFLDEINSMDLSMQVKLLKVLEEKKIRRIGGDVDIRFDVRIVCATNERPEELLASGRLREDLYYRIGVVRLWIPPLRQRRDDVLLLTDHFIQMYNGKMNRRIQGLSDMVREFFEAWEWPGNVRELKNTIESAFNLAQGDQILIGDIQGLLRHSGKASMQGERMTLLNCEDDLTGGEDGAEEIPIELRSQKALQQALDGKGIDLQGIMEQCEAYLIRQTLLHEQKLNNVAKKLSISPQRLNYKLDRYRLRQHEKKG